MAFLLLVVASIIMAVSSVSVDAFQFQRQSKNWGSSRRRDVLITITTASPLVSLLTPKPVLAKDESMNYQAVWFDPKNPDGYRVLFGDDQRATLLLKDGLSDNEATLPVRVIKGEEGKETKLTFDFSKLGLPTDVEGTFTRNREKVRIISFDNGKNYWINKKFEGPIGVFKDSTNSKRVIIIRQVNNNRGSDCMVEFHDGGSIISFTATAGNTFTFNNFPDKGEVTATFNMFRRTLTFEDGTVWTKY
mmetsp:Transcript_34514/g.83523  ORF Transcript_34514/g.83523 Transcript_34514/m.83523 type:complete len:247 (-) Transcript_34514:102-842(-)